MIHNLAAAGARSIFFDVDFSASSVSQEDRELGKAMADPARVWSAGVLATFERSRGLPVVERAHTAGQGPRDTCPRQSDSWAGWSGARNPWSAGVARFGPETAVGAVHESGRNQAASVADRLSNFARIISASVVCRRRQECAAIRCRWWDRVCRCDGSRTVDLVAVPVHRALPGVVIQALAVETASRTTLIAAPPWLTVPGLLVWVLMCAGLFVRARWSQAPALASLLICLVLAAAVGLYALADLIVPVAPFIVGVIVALTGSLLGSLNVQTWLSWRALLRSRQQDRLLRSIVEVSSDAVFTLDAQGIVRSANPATAALLGVSPTRLIDAPLDAQTLQR